MSQSVEPRKELVKLNVDFVALVNSLLAEAENFSASFSCVD